MTDIVAIDLSGHQTNLTHNPAPDLDPAVARDGRIVFLSARGGNPDLYVMDGDGRHVRRLTNSAVDNSGIAAADDSSSASQRGRRAETRSRSTASTWRGRPIASSTARAGT
jgi:TolB protein